MTRVRVHEIARELGVSCDDILDFLDDVGVKVRDRSSVLAESVQGRIRGRFAGGGHRQTARSTTVASSSRRRRPERVTHDHPSTAEAVTVETVSVPPAVGPDVLFLAPGAVPAQGSASPAEAAPPARPRATSRRSPIPQQRTAVAPPAEEPTPADDVAVAAAMAGWMRRDFTEEEFLRWQSAGMAVDESALADQCRTAGIEPDQLALVLSGRTALLRLRGGETATSVWARIAEGEQYRSRGNRLGGRFALS